MTLPIKRSIEEIRKSLSVFCPGCGKKFNNHDNRNCPYRINARPTKEVWVLPEAARIQMEKDKAL